MYPRILHKGPASNRDIKRVEDEHEHAKAAKQGWTDKPAAWTDDESAIADGGDSADGDDDADDKREIPAVKESKAAKKAKK